MKKKKRASRYRPTPPAAARRRAKPERVPKTPGQLRLIMALAIGFFFLAFAVMFFMAFLQDRDLLTNGSTLAGLAGTFGCFIISIWLLLAHIGDFLDADLNKGDEKYSRAEFTVLHGCRRTAVEQAFLRRRFKELDGGFFYKRKVSFLKDFICYYAKSCNVQESFSAVSRAESAYEALAGKKSNTCLLLFLYKDSFGESDLAMLRELAKMAILKETVVPASSVHSVILIAVDDSGSGRYLDIGSRFSISVYASGCRLLKKLFGRPN